MASWQVVVSRRSKYRALGLLRMEIENLRRHGFHGLLCLGTDQGRRYENCDECPLLDLVPREHQQAATPCLAIPLNERGETIETILQRRDQAYLEKELLRWMERTVQRFEDELAQGESPED